MEFSKREFNTIHAALICAAHDARKLALFATAVPSMEWCLGMQANADSIEKLAERIINESGAF